MEGDPVHVDDVTDRETFYTDAGRIVYGGGGITPDITVMPDTLTSTEQVFREALAESELALRDATFRFSVQWVHDHPELGEDFEITPAIRDALYNFIVDEKGVEVDRDLFDDATDWIDWELGIRIAQSAFGEEASLKRTLRRQPQVTKAIALLRQTDTPQDLIALATSESAAVERVDVGPMPTPN